MYVLIEISAYGTGKNPMILQIAATRLDTEKLVRKQTFSAYVRPDDMTLVNWSEEEYLQNIKPFLMDAAPIDQVFKKLHQWITEADYLYCWDETTRSIYRRISKRLGYSAQKIKTIRKGVLTCLNDQHIKNGNPIRLCSVRGYGVSGSSYNAKKVLNAMFLLIRKTGKTPGALARMSYIPKRTTQNEGNHGTASRAPERSRLQNAEESQETFLFDTHSSKLPGLFPCSCCSPILEIYRENETELSDYCRQHAITIIYHNDALYIHSRYDFWRIIFDAEKQELVLLHKNTKMANNKADITPVTGFHVQKCEATTLKGILKNVAAHDLFREHQDQNEIMNMRKAKAARKVSSIEKKRKIRRTLALIEELKASGQL